MAEWINGACRLCRSPNFLSLGRRSEPMPTRIGVLTIEIEDAVCLSCGMAQNALTPPDGFLDNLYKNQFANLAHSVDDAHYDAAVRLQILKQHIASGTVIEFGSAAGEFCQFLRDAGYNSFGVDPGIGNGLSDAPTKVQAIVTYDVIEHLEDPRSAIGSLRDHLSDDGILIIEVPDYERHTATALGPQHLTYFTAKHLRTMIEVEGFDAITTPKASRDAGLCIVGRKAGHNRVPYFKWAESREQQARAIEITIGRVPPGSTVFIWPTNDIASTIGARLPNAIPVDASPDKCGATWPKFNNRIVRPDQVKSGAVVILCSPAWNDEIERSIKDLGVTIIRH